MKNLRILAHYWYIRALNDENEDMVLPREPIPGFLKIKYPNEIVQDNIWLRKVLFNVRTTAALKAMALDVVLAHTSSAWYVNMLIVQDFTVIIDVSRDSPDMNCEFAITFLETH